MLYEAESCTDRTEASRRKALDFPTMADPDSPNTTTHLRNPQLTSPIKRKSFTLSLCKSFSILCIIVFIPLFPSKPPIFINQPIIIKFWELIYLSFVGIVLCYGVFSRRNVKIESENQPDLDNHSTYFGNPFESSSNNKMIHPWDSEIDSSNPDSSMASIRLGSEFRNPSSRSSDPNSSSRFSIQDGSFSDRSGSGSEDENFVGDLKLQIKDRESVETGISPLSLPWNLRFQTEWTGMGVDSGSVLGNSTRSIHCGDGSWLEMGSSSENSIPSELGYPNDGHNNFMESNVSPDPIQWNLRYGFGKEESGVFRNPKSRISDRGEATPKLDNASGGFIPQLSNSFENKNIVSDSGFQKSDHEFVESNVLHFPVHSNLRSHTHKMQEVEEAKGFHPSLKVVPFSSKEFQSDLPESQPGCFLGTDEGDEFQELEVLNSQKHSNCNSPDGSELALLLESSPEMSSSRTEPLEKGIIEPENSKIQDLDPQKSSDLPSSLTPRDFPDSVTHEAEVNNTSLGPPEFLNPKTDKRSSADVLSISNKKEAGDAKRENKMAAFLRGKSVRRIRKQIADNDFIEKIEVRDNKSEVRDNDVTGESDHNKPEAKKISAAKPKRTNRGKGRLRFLGFTEDDEHSRKGRNKEEDVDSMEIDKKAGEFIARFKNQMRCDKVEGNEVDRKAGEFIAKFKEQIRVEKASREHH